MLSRDRRLGNRKTPRSSYRSKLEFNLPKPLTKNQSLLAQAILNVPLTVTLGPSGTGKTYIPSCYAANFYKTLKVKKIVITRPNMPVGKTLGSFPGTMLEKMEGWVRPILDVLEDAIGKGAVECMLKDGNIEVAPFETIRGRSWSDSFIILDEAQNTTKEEVKAFVTRIGERSTVVINGDVRQSDLRNQTQNGLSYLIKLVRDYAPLQEQVSIIEFTSDDIVRSDLCKQFVKAFEIYD